MGEEGREEANKLKEYDINGGRAGRKNNKQIQCREVMESIFYFSVLLGL